MVKRQQLIMFLFLGIVARLPANAISLNDAIKSAIQNNPRTAAIDSRLEAMRLRHQAQKMDLWPSLNISASQSFSQSRPDGSDSSSSRNRNGSLDMSVNLYNGGADVENLKASAARLRATEAQYNSSNSFIPNSRGRFAVAVFESYLKLVESYEQLKSVNDMSDKLDKLMKASWDEEEYKTLQQRKNDLKTWSLNVEFDIEEAQKDFSYFTTLPAPDAQNLFTLVQLKNSLIIPKNPEEAFSIALEKSPEIKNLNYSLQAQEHERMAERKRLYRPRVDLRASYDGNNSYSDGSTDKGTGSYIGVSVSYRIGAGIGHRSRAEDAELSAVKSERDATIADVRYNLAARYQDLKNQEEVYRLQLDNYKQSTQRLNDLFSKIESGGAAVDFKDMLDALDAYSSYRDMSLRLKTRIINLRFNLQRTVGTLFDFIGLPSQDDVNQSGDTW